MKFHRRKHKDNATIKRFKDDLIDHGGNPEAIDDVRCDMSHAIIKGIKVNLPNAQLSNT